MKYIVKKQAKKVLKRLGYNAYPVVDRAFDTKKDLFKGKEVRTIFDLGALGGGEAKRYLNKFPEGTVYSFEPMEKGYSDLVEMFKNESRVKPQQYAVSNTNGTSKFFINKKSDTSSLLPSNSELSAANKSNLSTDEVTEIPTITIDSFCEEHSISEIDILKMDIQGGELMALKGASEMLKKTRLIYTEIFFKPYYENQPLFGDINGLLCNSGFKFHSFHNMGISGQSGEMLWADAIFISPELEKSNS